MAHPKGTPRAPGAGRQKGTPNKVTTMIKEVAAKKLAAAREPDVDSKDRMRKMAMLLDSLAGQEFQKPPETRDIELVANLAFKALSAWDKVAKYEHPTLASVHVTREPIDPGTLSDDELTQLEGIVAKASVARGDQDREGQTLN